MPKVTVRGVGIHYEDVGRGEPLLLLHGALGTGRRHFRHQVDALTERFRIILPDTFGYGRSDHRPRFDPDFYWEDAAQMVELLGGLGIERTHVGGFSDGAITALCLAMEYPDLVCCLALFGASTYIDEENLAELAKLTPPESLAEPLQQALARAHGEPYWRDLVRVWFAGQAEIVARGGNINRHRLSDVHCPILLVHGAADDVIGTYHAEVIKAAHPEAELVILPGCGHFVLQEAPKETTEILLCFLEQHPIGPS
ncbi:MAG TPA: alpha/beta hydrolase [Dehalococcoidia bacterium]|nr:alpha/beta hydrolase [Dehalococcoidia bacterium]